jgi:hypothetical protein
MSDFGSESDIESSSEGSSHCTASDSEVGDVDEEIETSEMPTLDGRTRHGVDRDKIAPYVDEPTPTTAWLEEYRKRRQAWLEDMEVYTGRLQNRINLQEW